MIDHQTDSLKVERIWSGERGLTTVIEETIQVGVAEYPVSRAAVGRVEASERLSGDWGVKVYFAVSDEDLDQ